VKLLAIISTSIIVVLAACKSSPDNIVATLEDAVASVERMPAADTPWKLARKGDT
jgi:hypothetical protein